MVQYGAAQFKDDLRNLQKMLNEQIGEGQSGGSAKRTFRIVRWNNEFVPPDQGGTLKGRSPSAAVRKALRSHLNVNNLQDVKVTLLEVTRGSKRKEWGPYRVQRLKLDKPRVFKVTNKKTGKPKTMKISYTFDVKYIGGESK